MTAVGLSPKCPVLNYPDLLGHHSRNHRLYAITQVYLTCRWVVVVMHASGRPLRHGLRNVAACSNVDFGTISAGAQPSYAQLLQCSHVET